MSELSVLMWVTLGEKFNYLPSLPSHGPAQPSWSMTDIWGEGRERGRATEREGGNKLNECVFEREREREREREKNKEQNTGKHKETVRRRDRLKDWEAGTDVCGETGEADYKDAFPWKHLTFTNQAICPWWRSERYGRHIPETRLLEAVWFYETSNKVQNKWI